MLVWLLFAGLFLGGCLARTAYEELKRRKRLKSGNRIAYLSTFVAMIAMWVGWFNMPVNDPWPVALPDALPTLGAVLPGVGYVLVIGGVIQLRGVENIPRLVTGGLFAKLRHPMYTGFICWIAGESLRCGAWLSCVVGCVAIVQILYWRTLEEAFLMTIRPAEYAAYRANTWF